MSLALFTPVESGRQVVSDHWCLTKDGDPQAYAMYRRHYSCKNRNPKIRQFVGPGESMVLISTDGKSLFAWRRFIDDSGQQGVNCAVFRNEGRITSSTLIVEACALAWQRWPGERLYTFVSPSKIRKIKRHGIPVPGFCFRKAGFTECGFTKSGLLILERYP